MDVFGLVHSALPTTFPPLRSPEGLPSSVPVHLTTLVGRHDDFSALEGLTWIP